MPKLTAKRRVKRPDAKRIAKPKIVVVGHGGASRALLKAPFDMRSQLGRAYRTHSAALAAHLGSDLSAPEAALVDQAARLRLLTQVAWSELQRGGAFRAGELLPAFDAYRKAAGDERAVLLLLGLRPRVRELSLGDVLAKEQS